jgi:hypothetical protein
MNEAGSAACLFVEAVEPGLSATERVIFAIMIIV